MEGLEMKTALDSIVGLKEYLIDLKDTSFAELLEQSFNVADCLNSPENYILFSDSSAAAENSDLNIIIPIDIEEEDSANVRRSTRPKKPNQDDDFYYSDSEIVQEILEQSISTNETWNQTDFLDFVSKVIQRLIDSLNSRFEPLKKLKNFMVFFLMQRNLKK